MCSNKECADYFKGRTEYRRCFEEFRKKWKSYGRAAGRITLAGTSEEERQAIGGVLGKKFYEETIRFSFSEFEKGLQKTRFAPVDMQKVLEEYFGEVLLAVKDQREEEQSRRKEFLESICEQFEDAAGRESGAFWWLREMSAAKGYGYQLLMREYGKNRKQAGLLAQNVGKAVIRLSELRYQGRECPLAVFAAEISGNPHYFDRGTAAGQLLIHAVCFCEKAKLPQSAHQWRKLLMEVGIVPDNVSSMVHACGLRLLTAEGWHPAYDSFCARREPCVITMENLRGVTGAQAVGGRVYIVENEMVFSYLIDCLKKRDITLLCTSGQLRSAAQVLLLYLLASGTEIYYNGDIDPEGLCIADGLWQKSGGRIRMWRMSPEDYRRSCSKEEIGKGSRAKLQGILNPVLQETARCVLETGYAGYQENMLEELVGDICREEVQTERDIGL